MNFSDLLDRPIAFQRAFVRLGVGITGALMLSHAIECDATIADKQRWFYKSQADWEKETGLTRFQQETARKSLVRAGILQEWRRGIPARLYFRISLRTLRVLLTAGPAE